jgi:hypothetical protein
MKHILKCDRGAFIALEKGKKKAEFRRNDRGYKKGDILELYEMSDGYPDGKYMIVQVSHIQEGYGIPEGYAMLSVGYKSRTHYMNRRACRERLGMALDKPVYEKQLSFRDELMADMA